MKVVVLLLACFILLIVGNGANAVTKFILFVHSNYIIGQLIIKKSLFSTRLSKKNEEQCMIMLQCVYTYTVKNIKIILKLDNYTLLCSDNNEISLT